jgi:cryptochrome
MITIYFQDIISSNAGAVPLTLADFYAVVRKMDKSPPKPCPTITAAHFKTCKVQIANDHDIRYGIPSMQSLGMQEPTNVTQWVGGETEALNRLSQKLKNPELLYKISVKTSTNEEEVEKPSPEQMPETTGLSSYINLGSMSVRQCWHDVLKITSNVRTTMHGQLLYREFFYTVAFSVNNFTRIAGNRICTPITWNDPNEPEHAARIAAFKAGKTGFPWIDASIRQMVAEGWISHISRFSIATFLTVGQMWCSWEIGQQVNKWNPYYEL